MPKWEEPKIVKLDALPDVLGACVDGASNLQGSNCHNGGNPANKCGMGNSPRKDGVL